MKREIKNSDDDDKNYRNAFIFWSILFLIIMILSLKVFPSVSKCKDGSTSHSIGRQGACSHHKGINGDTFVFNLIGSSFLTVILSLKISAADFLNPTFKSFEFVNKKNN